jgi:hypothetical protein
MSSPHRSRRGAVASGVVCVGLLLAAAAIVMAVSGQASMTRTVQATTTVGRYAVELAESAIDECLAEFSLFIAGRMRGQDLRALFLANAKGGVVPAAAITGGKRWEFFAHLSTSLAEEQQTSITLSMVTVTPLFFSTVQNFGQVELSCQTRYRLHGASELCRRVSSIHYFVLDADGRTLRINPVALQVTVDRRAS